MERRPTAKSQGAFLPNCTALKKKTTPPTTCLDPLLQAGCMLAFDGPTRRRVLALYLLGTFRCLQEAASLDGTLASVQQRATRSNPTLPQLHTKLPFTPRHLQPTWHAYLQQLKAKPQSKEQGTGRRKAKRSCTDRSSLAMQECSPCYTNNSSPSCR